ncbi:hypothetical protein UNDYM_5341 [Undibacterium sp. YM2]|nr:hypothetical protein UNDYM_5341 [Undibacterium sp. YM2]
MPALDRDLAQDIDLQLSTAKGDDAFQFIQFRQCRHGACLKVNHAMLEELYAECKKDGASGANWSFMTNR